MRVPAGVASRPSPTAQARDDRSLWLLERWPKVEAAFLAEVARGTFELVHLTPSDLTRMGELVVRYADFPLGAVDASVVAVAERFGTGRVATLDRRHFNAVRPAHLPALTLLP